MIRDEALRSGIEKAFEMVGGLDAGEVDACAAARGAVEWCYRDGGSPEELEGFAVGLTMIAVEVAAMARKRREALGGHADHPDDVAERIRAFDRAALRVYLSACSEEEECAGWSEWCIQDLWRRACDPGESGDRIETIRLLCERAHGWWHWPRGASGPAFVALDEWEQTTGLRLVRRIG